MDIGEIGARIRAAREARGLTQGGLAELVGVSRSAVAQWETGRSGQVGGNLAAIARCLGVSVEHLLLGSGAGQIAQELGWAEGMTGDEMALIRLYRQCNPADRAVILHLLRGMAEKNS